MFPPAPCLYDFVNHINPFLYSYGMERTDITYFFENFFQKTRAAFQQNDKCVARAECRFLGDMAMTFYTIPIQTCPLTNYTQHIQSDHEWTYVQNNAFTLNGIIQYFCESPVKYQLFRILKDVMTSKSFISEEQRALLLDITKNEQSIKIIYTFMTNKVLLSIYEIWRTRTKSRQDAHMISSTIDEIYRKHQIQPNWGNRPNLQQIENPGILDPDRVYCLLLQSAVSDDNYTAYYEIWTFLTEYLDMLRGYSNSPATNPATKEIPEKKRKKSIPAALKRKVWNKWVGEEIGKTKCLCCQLTEITQLSFHCGHIIAEANGGELKMDNLKPICSSCNSSMGTTNMDVFMNTYGF